MTVTVMSGKVLRNATWTGIRVATAFTFLFVFPQLMVGYIYCRCGSHNILDLRVYKEFTDRIEGYYWELFGSCFFEIFDWKSPDLLWQVVKQPYGKHWEAVLVLFPPPSSALFFKTLHAYIPLFGGKTEHFNSTA